MSTLKENNVFQGKSKFFPFREDPLFQKVFDVHDRKHKVIILASPVKMTKLPRVYGALTSYFTINNDHNGPVVIYTDQINNLMYKQRAILCICTV